MSGAAANNAPPDLAAWFRRRTWSVDDLDVTDLVARKAACGTSVSVVLPAHNEEATIGGVVAGCAELGGQLVDEIVVVDGGSTDDTARLAAEAGARVHLDRAILSDVGRPAGKGDALWRSLAVTSGELVCFLDADIHNPDARFVVGLVAPLLLDADVQLVKGFYDRPLQRDGHWEPSGGGRVTELCARPLINLFWPELAGLVQPLAGEYAGRRPLLEALPFFTGYGVELGLLIDVLRHAGADAIAQVDLHQRVHANKPLQALGPMAFGIAQVAARRLADEGRAEALGDLPSQWVQFARAEDGVAVQAREVEVHERPAMRTLR